MFSISVDIGMSGFCGTSAESGAHASVLRHLCRCHRSLIQKIYDAHGSYLYHGLLPVATSLPMCVPQIWHGARNTYERRYIHAVRNRRYWAKLPSHRMSRSTIIEPM